MLRFYFMSDSMIILFALIIECADKIASECDKVGKINSIPELMTFANIQRNIFDVSCALAGCHAASG